MASDQNPPLWVVDIKLLMVREDRAEVEEIAQAVMAWAKGTYAVDPYLNGIKYLPPVESPPGLTRAQATHNLHLAIFGRQENCSFCAELEDARQ